VGDHDHRGAGLVLGLLEHLQHLGLDGHVEGRGGLVGDDHVGVVGDRLGDHGALPHAPRELVREGLHPQLGVGDAHQVEQVDRALPRLFAGDVVVGLDRLDDLVADGVDGRQRRQRVLEDHGELVAADLDSCASVRPISLAVQLDDPDACRADAAP
jgi:hypothetical protein